MQLFKIVHTSIQTRKIDEHKLWQSRAGRHCPIPAVVAHRRNYYLLGYANYDFDYPVAIKLVP